MTDEALAEYALTQGRADWAFEILRRPPSQEANPATLAALLHQQALQSLQAERWAEAIPFLERAIRLEPQTAERYDHLGVALARSGRLSEAVAAFQVAVRLAPNLASAFQNWIQALADLRRFAEMIPPLQAALARRPNDLTWTLWLATALAECQQYAEAEACLLKLGKTAEQEPFFWNRLGVIYGQQQRLEDAIRCFATEARLAPQSAWGFVNWSAALGKAGRWQEAADAARQATKLDPRLASAWSNLGNAYRDLGRLTEAEAALRQASQLDPRSSEAAGNLGLTLAMAGRLPEALAYYEEALRRKPDNPEVRFNRAVAFLALGEWEVGFREYEWRWQTEQMRGQSSARRFTQPLWQGESLAGRRILIHCEQGHGDTFQFIRFVRPLAEASAVVYVLAAGPTASLIRTVPGVAKVLQTGELMPEFDFHLPLLSLPSRLKLTPQSIPQDVPYLKVPPEAVARWQTTLAPLPGRRIGLVWQGNPRHVGDRWRSMPLASFSPLARLKDISWVSLQKGYGREQLTTFEAFPIQDFAAHWTDDFADTAGLLMGLDAVITVDTAIAHLAGALGRTVHLLVAANPDWRWLRDRADSPWYPTLRIHRQTRFGDWSTVWPSCLEALEQ